MMKKCMISAIFILLSTHLIFGQDRLHSDSIDILHYHIAIDTMDFENESISACCIIDLRSKVNNLDKISLDLLQLTIDSVVQTDITPHESLSWNYNDTVLNIFTTALQENESMQIKVCYHGQPRIDPSSWGGFYFDGAYAFNLGVGFEDIPHNYGRVWYPCIDDFIDRATYSFEIETRKNHTAVCNGLCEQVDTIAHENEDTTLVYHWNMTDPIPSYLSSIAVGQYVAVSNTYEGIERDIPVDLYVYPGNESDAEGSFTNLHEILYEFETRFGAYPWQRVGYVAVPFNSGAMEHATNIAIPAVCINGYTTYESLFAHELSHHWFGDYITCHDAEEMWINEGWATYCETLHQEFMHGADEAMDYRRSYHAEVLRMAHHDDGGMFPLNDVPQNVTYSSTSYEKGASVVHSLRHYLGDSLFYEGTKAVIRAKAHEDISSEEMMQTYTDSIGVPLSDFFDTWVFQPGFPHYSIDSSITINSGASSFDVTVYVRQRSYGRDFLGNSNRLPVSFMKDDYTIVDRVIEFDGEIGQAEFNLDFNPILIMADYHQQVSDATVDYSRFLNNTYNYSFGKAFFKASVEEITDSVFFRVTHNYIPPDPFEDTIPGMFLSNKRFWLIEGSFPESFESGGVFYYGTGTSGPYGYLDNELITNDLDSLRLLYRQTPADDWEVVPAQENSVFTKRISIENLHAGEYTLGMYDWELYQKTEAPSVSDPLQMYPNPAKDYCQISHAFEGICELRIYSLSGVMLQNNLLGDKEKNYLLDISHLPKGMYIIQIENKKEIYTDKLIVK